PIYGTTAVAAPTVNAADLNGFATVSFEPGQSTATFFRCGTLGMAGIPPAWSVARIVRMEDATAEVNLSGSDQVGGMDGVSENISTNSWGFLDTSDFQSIEPAIRSMTTGFG